MHNYVRSASAFERQQHERRKNILIVSRSVTWQYRCPSYNQQREREEGKTTQDKSGD